MTHLGDRITPLVDGQLPVDATERAHVHLASCDGCREAVETERLMKSRLASLGCPQPGTELMARLIGLAGPDGPLPPRAGHVPGSPRPRTVVAPGRPVRASARPAGRPTAAVRPAAAPRRAPARLNRARVTAAMVGALCLVGAGVAGGVASTAAPNVRPSVTPPVDTFVVQHTLTTSTLPFGDQTAGWGSAGAGR